MPPADVTVIAPVLMVARTWEWDLTFVLTHFGWRALGAIVTSTTIYWLVFRSELAALSRRPPRPDAFEPDPAAGNRGPQGHADVKDGRFDTRLSGKGAVVGPQIARVTGGDGVNPKPFAPFGRALFDEQTFRIEVSEGPPLQFDVPGPRARKR